MAIAHHLGFPRMGANRELKWALEKYWKGDIQQNELAAEGARIRETNWAEQIAAGHDFLSVGDFSFYDHVLDTASLLGVIPPRFQPQPQPQPQPQHQAQPQAEKNQVSTDGVSLDTYFRMARGRAPTGTDTHACEMTKWFDTNYHYIVPEFKGDQQFKISSQKLFAEVEEAKKLGKPIKAIVLGPLSFLWLGKVKQANNKNSKQASETDIDKLSFLDSLTKVYQEILQRLREQGVQWVQIDEPILVLDLPQSWQKAFEQVYRAFTSVNINLLLTTYFGGLEKNTALATRLPTAGLHIDIVRAPQQLADVLNHLPHDKVLSLGIVDGRNIWRIDLKQALSILKPVHQQLGERLWIGSSCSLLHSPHDLKAEIQLDAEFKSWLSFAIQKNHEIALLVRALNQGEDAIVTELIANELALHSRKTSTRIHNPVVKKRASEITPEMTMRDNKHHARQQKQQAQFNLPLFPTTTIGSFPQTQVIRNLRRDFKAGNLSADQYRTEIRKQIAYAIRKQLDLGLDVLVHGEAERNDMVEYFGELLQGFAFTQNGWVQSYGSRCVKPPIIYGDVSRANPMTVEWACFAQSLTNKPVKGMLTGPITILCWSFVRDDQSRFETAKQIALALRDEVRDLVANGINIIQIDEPAVREGLPLQKKYWADYLQQAVYCFRLASCTVRDHIQIHTHMCYSEFNDIIEAVAELDADVITIETSRSDMELLQAFETFNYPNEIGPGVYDIHSPRVPTVEDIVQLIDKAAQYISKEQLWVNPDCGLKTRDWLETEMALQNMVTAAKQLRAKYAEAKARKAS